MKKTLLNLLAVIIVLTMGACGNQDQTEQKQAPEKQVSQSAEQKDKTVSIQIKNEKKLVTEKDIKIKEDEILMDLLKDNFSVKEEKGFITSIEGIHPKKGEENKYGWVYYVNGKMPNVGAADYKLKAGDEVRFEYQKYK